MRPWRGWESLVVAKRRRAAPLLSIADGYRTRAAAYSDFALDCSPGSRAQFKLVDRI